MNIYALKGHKIKVTAESIKNGMDDEQQRAEKLLIVGGVYTVERTEVGGWATSVWIQEIPSEEFNSVSFKDVKRQTKAKDKEHPDYDEYN